MSAPVSSSAQRARKALADRLKEMGRDAGLDGKDLASVCGFSPSKISRIINGVTAPSEDDIRRICSACRAEDQTADLIASMRAAEGMYVQWRRMERRGLRHAQEAQLPLYERTRRFRSYSSWLVPGMIQTRAYTRSVLTLYQERRGLVDDIDEALQARMDRQRILHEGDHQFAFLVEESVLRSSVASAEVMAGQLGHLISIASLPNVSLGIVPMRPGRRSVPVEGFWIFDVAQVNVELVSGFLTIQQPGEISMYESVYAELAQDAVYGPAARRLITTAMDACC